jgi:FlaA1/EpsC-like NDP-sugar epimerase
MNISTHNSFPFEIEDLIESAPVALDEALIKQQVQNKIILITGAAGSIGSEMVRQLIPFETRKMIFLDQAETPLYELELEILEDYHFHDFVTIIGNVSDKERMEHVFKRFRPDIIYHTAAYKHVPIMEFNAGETVRTNILGTKILAELAEKYEVEKFIHISSGKAVNPASVMGASKRMTELYIQAKSRDSHTSFATTRFGNVLGSNGSVVSRFMKQIVAGGPVTVTHPEVTRYFMTLSEACQLVLEAGAMSRGGEIYLFDMGEPMKVADLARKMIRLSGSEPDKEIQLEFTHLRSGEKLHEELLGEVEQSEPTAHSRIRIVRQLNHRHADILRGIAAIERLYRSWDEDTIIKKLEKLIPEFKRQHMTSKGGHHFDH